MFIKPYNSIWDVYFNHNPHNPSRSRFAAPKAVCLQPPFVVIWEEQVFHWASQNIHIYCPCVYLLMLLSKILQGAATCLAEHVSPHATEAAPGCLYNLLFTPVTFTYLLFLLKKKKKKCNAQFLLVSLGGRVPKSSIVETCRGDTVPKTCPPRSPLWGEGNYSPELYPASHY